MKMDLLMAEKHSGEFAFQHGLEIGMWGLQTEALATTWPVITIWIQADPKYYEPGRCYFKFTLDGYPQVAPGVCPWDMETNSTLVASSWPKGSSKLNSVFNPNWRADSLYAPFDRAALPGHDEWKTKYPEYYWQPSFKFTDYVQYIHRLLNS